MGIFNEHSSSSSDTISSGVQGPPGPQGPPGIGFNLDANNNFNLENKKLINVKPGTNNNDVVTKSQIQYLDGVLPAQVTKNKAVIYSPSGSVHTNDLYLKDKNGQEVHFYNEDQDLNQCRLYVPNLKNNDSYSGRLKSDIMKRKYSMISKCQLPQSMDMQVIRRMSTMRYLKYLMLQIILIMLKKAGIRC